MWNVSLPSSGNTFLWNFGLHNMYTAPHLRRRHSSLCFLFSRIADDGQRPSLSVIHHRQNPLESTDTQACCSELTVHLTADTQQMLTTVIWSLKIGDVLQRTRSVILVAFGYYPCFVSEELLFIPKRELSRDECTNLMVSPTAMNRQLGMRVAGGNNNNSTGTMLGLPSGANVMPR
jgi:hypothetical protein